MQLHISSHTLLLLPHLFFWSSALPFQPYPQRVQPERILIPRASYSVVPVDGGAPTAAAGGPVGATTTITETVVHTAPAPAPTTVTIISTAVVPHDPATVTSVVTMVESSLIQTSIVTITPALAPASVSITAFREQATTSESKPSPETTPATISYHSPTLVIPSPLAFTPLSDSGPSTTESATRSTIAPSSTHDDGLWRTTYPPWSNSTSATALAIKPRQTTILLSS